MPSARLLALAPAPGQQLLLRSATATATASSGGGSDSRAGSASASASASASTSRPSPPRAGAASRPHLHLHLPRPLAAPSWCRCASTVAAPHALFSPIYHHTTTTRVAGFGTATLPKHVAFPRHGKAVEPQLIGDHTKDGKTRDKHAHASKNGKRPPRKTILRRSKNGASAKAKGDGAAPTAAAAAAAEAAAAAKVVEEAEAEAAEAEEVEAEEAEEIAAEDTEETEDVTAQATAPEELDESIANTGPPSVSVDAQKELGRSTDASSTPDAAAAAAAPTAYPGGVAELAADAAAAAATAAETASLAASIVNDSLVIELGPPKPAMGAISGPSEADPSAPGPRREQERIALPASLRQPLSQKPPPPHLVPPPYVHHFDSYSLVRQLEGGGYSQEQAITAMKGVRLLLAQNLDVAQSSLVSKSDVENEAYLFKAACAELSIEVRNNRRRADEQIRQQRTLLQSEVDIAAQSVNQELVTLTDVVKGLFNDRKMAVREEQKALESKVQQLNYKITIMLNSEMRSEIEALRWVLIRRSVLGIIFMVLLMLGSLRYASYVGHEKQKQAERAAREAREAEMQRYADSKIDSSSPPDAAEILAAN